MAIWVTTLQDDMLDEIVARHYGSAFVHKAFDYTLQHPNNQNVARTLSEQGYRFETGQQLYLPDLPDNLLIQESQRQVKIFDD